jgi:PKD repeat protein
MGRRCNGKGGLFLILLLVVFLPVFLLSCNGGGDGGSSTPATVADFSATPTTGAAPLTVAFTDNSTGSPTSWSWDFGDGSAIDNTQNPSHTYAAAGTYDVTLTADGPGGTDNVTKAGYITVTVPAPVAQFSGTPLTGPAALDVTFTDASTGTISTWSWDFGDNTAPSALQDPSHTYAAEGLYTVSLTVTGPGGSNTNTKPNYISVGAAPPAAPVAGFSADNTTGVAPLGVQFTDTSTGGPVSTWSWDFGDNTTSTLQDPTHTYSTPGTYDVTLAVTGPGGSDNVTQAGYITVDPFVMTDDFNRADADPIGAPWVTITGQGDVAISSMQLKGSVEASPGGGAYYNASFDNNQYSQATIAAMSNVGVTVRTSPTERSYYRFQVIDAANADIGKYVNGTFTQLTPIAGTFAAGDVIRLEVSGSTLTAIQNGSTVGTATDSDLTGGFPGVRFFNSVGARLDDWEGGDLY